VHNLAGKRLLIAVVLNIIITAAQVVGGIISGSLSLLSDALHNFSDVVALLISYFANKLKQKKHTHRETYGYKRAEIIAALINATTLIGVAFYLVREALQRLDQPPEINAGMVMIFAVLGIVINAASAWILHGEAQDNMNVESAYLHLFADMLTSVAVLVGGIIMYYTQVYWVDSLLTLIIAVYLVVSSWRLLLRTLRVLMQFTPQHIDIHAIATRLEKLYDVDNIHHIHIWQVNDNEIHFEAHVDFERDLPLSEVGKILAHMRQILLDEYGIEHANLQPEYNVKDNKELVRNEAL